MKRGSLAVLAEAKWVPLETIDLEIELIPGGMPDFMTARQLGLGAALDRQVCSNAFVGFRNYTEDDGTEIKNSLQARMELYRAPGIRMLINNALDNLNTEAILGEAEGEQGSPDSPSPS